LLFLALFVVRSSSGASYVRTIEQNRRWSIGNDWVERNLSYSSENGLRTDGLIYKPAEDDFTKFSRSNNQYGEELQFKADGNAITNRSLLLTGADLLDIPGGKTLRLNCRTQDGSLGVSVVYAIYDDAAALRKWIQIGNKGKQAVSLSNLSFEA